MQLARCPDHEAHGGPTQVHRRRSGRRPGVTPRDGLLDEVARVLLGDLCDTIYLFEAETLDEAADFGQHPATRFLSTTERDGKLRADQRDLLVEIAATASGPVNLVRGQEAKSR